MNFERRIKKLKAKSEKKRKQLHFNLLMKEVRILFGLHEILIQMEPDDEDFDRYLEEFVATQFDSLRRFKYIFNVNQ